MGWVVYRFQYQKQYFPSSNPFFWLLGTFGPLKMSYEINQKWGGWGDLPLTNNNNNNNNKKKTEELSTNYQ